MRDTWASWLVMAVLASSCGGGAATPQATDPPPTAEPTAPPTTTSATTLAPTSRTSAPVEEQPSTTATDTTTVPAGVATTAAPPIEPTPTTAPVQTFAVLRGDGLGPFEFGSDATEVEAWALELFGPPIQGGVLRPPQTVGLGGRLRFDMQGGEVRWTDWENDLRVAFTDRSEFRDDGTMHLVWWEHRWGDQLLSVEGAPIPRTIDEFERAFSELVWLEHNCPEVGFLRVSGGATGAGLTLSTRGGLHAGAAPDCPEEPVAGIRRPGDVVAGLQLDGSGIVGLPIGTPIDEVLAALAHTIGPPDELHSVFGPAARASYYCFRAQHQVTQAVWTSPALSLHFHDDAVDDGAGGITSDGVVRLSHWHHWLGEGTAVIETPGGARPGMPFGELLDIEPETHLLPPILCRLPDSAFDANGPVRVAAEWDWVPDAQRALAERGYAVTITGDLDADSEQALHDFRAAEGIDEELWTDGMTGIDTLTALGITAPSRDAIVTAMSVGGRISCDGGC